MNEQEPRAYNFPWQYDTEHYLRVTTELGEIQMRPSTTELYLYPDDPEVDHIYIIKEVLADDTSNGYRLFRGHCDRIGEGAFSALVEQLLDHGFAMVDEEEPQASDIEAWEQSFHKTYQRPNSIDKVVRLALKNFEKEWDYIQDEPGWH